MKLQTTTEDCHRPVFGNPLRAGGQRFAPVMGKPLRALGGATKRSDDDGECDSDGNEKSTSEKSTKFTGMVARCNFFRSDLPHLQFVVKEASGSMATPHAGDMDKVVRVAEYLNGERRRLGQQFLLGKDDGIIHAFSGSD